jgi:hypothetical protein
LVEEKGFSEARISRGLEKLNNSLKKKPQTSLESFFGRPIRTSNGPQKSNKKRSSKKFRKK